MTYRSILYFQLTNNINPSILLENIQNIERMIQTIMTLAKDFPIAEDRKMRFILWLIKIDRFSCYLSKILSSSVVNDEHSIWLEIKKKISLNLSIWVSSSVAHFMHMLIWVMYVFKIHCVLVAQSKLTNLNKLAFSDRVIWKPSCQFMLNLFHSLTLFRSACTELSNERVATSGCYEITVKSSAILCAKCRNINESM